MKTYAFLALTTLAAAVASGCGSESLCERVECGTGGGTAATESATSTGTAQGPGSPASSGSSQPTTSTQSGGGDGGSSGSDGGGGDGQGAGGSGAGGDGGGGGTPIPTCEYEDGEVDESCAIFVDGGNEDAVRDGTRDSPYNTITEAITPAQNQGKTIFVCMAVEPYTEAVEIDASVRIVGGFGCANWPWSADDRTEWTAAAGDIPLRVSNDADVSLANLAITADDAPVGTPGASSIALFVVDSAVALSRCDITAGDGVDGVSPVQDQRADPAESGDNGTDGCQADDNGVALDGGTNSCGGVSRNGGDGGDGTDEDDAGESGSPGRPLPPGGGGVAGAAQGLADCGTGGTGGPGADATVLGSEGVGADGSGVLTAVGFNPASGGTATAGSPGAGGGGGGGAHKCSNGNFGPSGGGGGAGGCGGNPGAPGTGGGASVAIALLNSEATFDSTTVSLGVGGHGGAGAAGQLGQLGGDPGNAGNGGLTATACAGGPGGDGTRGGHGGGGRGGHAVGIMYAGNGSPPSTTGATVANAGTAGLGGDRSDGLPAGHGDDGDRELLLVVDDE